MKAVSKFFIILENIIKIIYLISLLVVLATGNMSSYFGSSGDLFSLNNFSTLFAIFILFFIGIFGFVIGIKAIKSLNWEEKNTKIGVLTILFASVIGGIFYFVYFNREDTSYYKTDSSNKTNNDYNQTSYNQTNKESNQTKESNYRSDKGKVFIVLSIIYELLVIITLIGVLISVYDDDVVKILVPIYLGFCVIVYLIGNASMRKQKRKIFTGVLMALAGSWILCLFYFMYFVVINKDIEDHNYYQKNTKSTSSFSSYIEQNDYVTCTKCFHAVPKSSKYCTFCGAKMKQDDEIVCPACGNNVPKNSTYCLYCGGKIDENTIASKNA